MNFKLSKLFSIIALLTICFNFIACVNDDDDEDKEKKTAADDYAFIMVINDNTTSITELTVTMDGQTTSNLLNGNWISEDEAYLIWRLDGTNISCTVNITDFDNNTATVSATANVGEIFSIAYSNGNTATGLYDAMDYQDMIDEWPNGPEAKSSTELDSYTFINDTIAGRIIE